MFADEYEPAPRWQDLIALPLIVGGGVGLALYFSGLPIWRVVLLAAVAVATAFCFARAVSVRTKPWSRAPLDAGRFATRNLDWLLAGAEGVLRDPERFASTLRPRLVALAAALLARDTVALDSAAAHALLGARNHQLLTDLDCRPPTRHELLVLVAAVTGLNGKASS